MAWMPLFFLFGRPIEATVDMFALVGAVSYLTYVWSQFDTVAAWCMAPYLAWLSFASYLCVGTSHLNGWDFSKKETKSSPEGKDTLYVNEKAGADKSQ
jgi:benzodiazapine receptor